MITLFLSILVHTMITIKSFPPHINFLFFTVTRNLVYELLGVYAYKKHASLLPIAAPSHLLYDEITLCCFPSLHQKRANAKFSPNLGHSVSYLFLVHESMLTPYAS